MKARARRVGACSPILALALALAGSCRQPTTRAPTNGSAGATTTERTAAPAGEPGEDAVARCGSSGQRLAAYEWLPSSARAMASIDLGSDAVEAALRQLAEHARGDGHAMPIDLAFAVGQWGWQIALVRSTLAQGGFSPAELVYLRMPDGTAAWVWAYDCDLEQALAGAQRAWPVHPRRSVSAVIATPQAGAKMGDPQKAGNLDFAFDVVFLQGDRAALVPAGHGASFVRTLSDARAQQDRGEPGPGPALAEIPAAPVRLVWAGRALLEPGAAAESPRLGMLTASADGVDGATVRGP